VWPVKCPSNVTEPWDKLLFCQGCSAEIAVYGAVVEWGLAGESPKKSGNKFCPPFTRHITRTSAVRNQHLTSRGKALPYHFIMEIDCVWNVMAHAQKPDFVFRRNGRVHLNWRGRQFSRLLAAEVCASAVVMVVMLDIPCYEVVWRVLATHSISQFPLHFPSHASPCAITFQLDSKIGEREKMVYSAGRVMQSSLWLFIFVV